MRQPTEVDLASTARSCSDLGAGAEVSEGRCVGDCAFDVGRVQVADVPLHSAAGRVGHRCDDVKRVGRDIGDSVRAVGGSTRCEIQRHLCAVRQSVGSKRDLNGRGARVCPRDVARPSGCRRGCDSKGILVDHADRVRTIDGGVGAELEVCHHAGLKAVVSDRDSQRQRARILAIGASAGRSCLRVCAVDVAKPGDGHRVASAQTMHCGGHDGDDVGCITSIRSSRLFGEGSSGRCQL